MIYPYGLIRLVNTSASPNGFPEGMMPSGVNDGMRETMASVRRFGEDVEWFNWGIPQPCNHRLLYFSW